MLVPEFKWIPFDESNPPCDVQMNEQYLILIRELYSYNGKNYEYVYSVCIATPYGDYLGHFWDTYNDWIDGQKVEVVAYADLPYSLREIDLIENGELTNENYL